ncbi:hypothetical protein KP509_02G027600 [Ceratopteris richardii]|uniref:Uncharacterized protein n=1 Tax=Ceratopteris richardii TaxID=49495 RepID=A0A8T2VC96_CERRI|nr:hypothetical protein KP509_02G027600 [Ceratopteris richardii]
MALLTPGILSKLLDNIGSDAKVAGSHRAAFLQVVGIVPALSGSDHLFPCHGFYIKVSDSLHSTYMSLEEQTAELILSNKLQVGQLIQVKRVDAGSPVPILRGVQTVPGKGSIIGQPQEMSLPDSENFSHQLDAANQFASSKSNNADANNQDNSSNELLAERRCSLAGADVRKKIEKSAEKQTSSSPVFTSPFNKTAIGRRSSERASWATLPFPEKEDSQTGRSGRTRVIPEFSPKTHSRSISASPARHQPVRSSLVFEREGLPCETAKDSPNARNSSQKAAISSAAEGPPKYRQLSPALKRASSVGKVGQRLSAEETKIGNNLLRRSASKGRSGDARSVSLVIDDKTSEKSTDASDDCSSRCAANKQVERAGSILKQAKNAKVGSGMCTLPCKDDRDPIKPSSTSSSVSSGGKNADLEPKQDFTEDAFQSNLLALGKKAQRRQLIASIAASEALLEASSTQAILQCLSDFAELCTAATPESPGPTVEKFFSLYRVLSDAGNNARALAQSSVLKCSEKKTKENVLSEFCKVSHDKIKAASSWVDAALSSGLTAYPFGNKDQKTFKSPFRPGFDGRCCKNKMNSFGLPSCVHSTKLSSCCTESPNLTNSVSSRGFMSPPICKAAEIDVDYKCNNLTSYTSHLEASRIYDAKQLFSAANTHASCDDFTSFDKKADVMLEWVEGSGFAEAVLLANQLQTEAELWFVRFIESSLDSGYKSVIKDASAIKRIRNVSSRWPDENSQVSAVLSDLKKVNEWLDEMSSVKWAASNPELEATTTKLKQKLYDLLIQLVLRSPTQVVSHSLCS